MGYLEGTDSKLKDELVVVTAHYDHLGKKGESIFNGADDNDSLFGNNGDDYVQGGAGNDYVAGGTDNDTLNGGIGNDTLVGNSGADVFEFTDASFGTDQINDFEDGVDMLDFSALGLSASDFTITQSGNDTVLTLNSDTSQTVTLLNTTATDIDLFDFV